MGEGYSNPKEDLSLPVGTTNQWWPLACSPWRFSLFHSYHGKFNLFKIYHICFL